MKKLQSNKYRVMAVGGLFALGLVSAPASGNHDHNMVAPAVAFIALGSILYYNHHRHHYQHHYKRHHYRHQPRHSSSYGGHHNPKRNHYGHGGNHNPKGNQYGHGGNHNGQPGNHKQKRHLSSRY